MFSFTDKTALLIGAGQNIGSEVAREFARRGAVVAIADINHQAAVEAARGIAAMGARAIGLHCDVTSEGSVRAAVECAESFFGPTDILMNNAGVLHSGSIQDFPPEEWERVFSVNLFGAVRANTIVLPGMIARASGYIVNTASFAGLYPYATNRMPYAASKSALISMSENMALDLEPKGVRVSCLCPGPTMTTLTDGMRVFSDSVPMRGPGADLRVLDQGEVAVILADAMEAGRILVPTHAQAWDTLREHAHNPDAFVRTKIAEYKVGKSGLPRRG